MTAPNYTYIYQNNFSHPMEKIPLEKNHPKFEKNNEVNHKNGISEKFDMNKEHFAEQEKCNMTRKSGCFIIPIHSSTPHRKSMPLKEKHDQARIDTIISEKNGEREMPRLTKEMDSESNVKGLKKPPVFNQRYQNVLRFPNNQQRKKCAFEKKLRRCGVELDGEATISNLRQILQPYIYQEINDILDKYIEVYFMKAFKNISENINLTSENWPQNLKSSITKSLYKKYCNIANVDPFNPLSISNDDFPYFQVSQRINHKGSIMLVDNSTKSEIDNSTGHTSDTNSQCSQFSIVEDKLEIDQDINIADISSSSEQTLEYPFDQFNGHVDSNMPRKRNIRVANQPYKFASENSSEFNETACSNRKYQKIVCPIQSYTNNSYVSHYDNNSSSFILQTIPEPETLETTRSKSRNQSFLLLRKTTEQSSSAIESGIYLNTQNLMTTNNNGDHLYPHSYPC